tara:strand:- start:30 stop:482 length:453 start_codon:yes stop_codon:yes gene_type:complete
MFFSELKNIIIHEPVTREKILNLLSQLTNINNQGGLPISQEEYNKFFSYLEPNTHIYVLINPENELVGMGTLVIESKLIHGGSKVAHIEDVVIDKIFRGKGYGKILMDNLIKKAQKFNCYKIILNCKEKNIGFYEKAGFQQNSATMSLYL